MARKGRAKKRGGDTGAGEEAGADAGEAHQQLEVAADPDPDVDEGSRQSSRRTVSSPRRVLQGSTPDASPERSLQRGTSVVSTSTARSEQIDFEEAKEGASDVASLDGSSRDVTDWSAVRASVAHARRAPPSMDGSLYSGLSMSDIMSHTDMESFADADRASYDARATSNRRRTLINILKCSFGCGVLGLPYAFAQGGMLAGIIGTTCVSTVATINVFLLIQAKIKLGRRARTYGHVGKAACGKLGYLAVEACVASAQIGFCCAYLIFITQNLHRYIETEWSGEITLALVPILVGLCWVRHLHVLAPFSLFAILLVAVGLVAVVYDSKDLQGTGKDVKPYILDTLPIFFGMACYSFEGVGMAIPMYNSMKKPERFPFVWFLGTLVVTVVYISFGAFCYSCYGIVTPEIITMVLPKTTTSLLVMVGLCASLTLTFPLAMFPVFEIVETHWLKKFLRPAPTPTMQEPLVPQANGSLREASAPDRFRSNVVRVVLVMATVLLSVAIPDFSVILALIGSLPCNIMAFVLPCLFHLIVFWDNMGFFGRFLDAVLLVIGISSVLICTSGTIFGIINGSVGSS